MVNNLFKARRLAVVLLLGLTTLVVSQMAGAQVGAEQAAAAGLLPIVSFLKIPEKGEPHLEGHQCKKCKAIFLGERSVCSCPWVSWARHGPDRGSSGTTA